MAKWISILRGINVGGKRVIKMPDLKKLYSNLGFTNVNTIIQSGNVTFLSDIENSLEIKNKIENGILNEFGFEVMAIIFSEDYLTTVLENNPFKNEDIKTQYFSFLENVPSDELSKKLSSETTNSNEVAIEKNIVYVFCPNGYSKTKFNNNYIERSLKVKSTTRNFSTVNKIVKNTY